MPVSQRENVLGNHRKIQIMKKIFVTLCCLFMTAAMQAKVILPDQIGDYMVLQQQTDAKLWGWATAGTR